MKLLPAFKYFTLLFLFTTLGCEETFVDPTFTVGQESSFRINQPATSTDGQYTLLINQINDSRCPEGVQCFWQGEVSLKGEWTPNGNKSDFELHSVLKNMNKQPSGFTIQIVDAKPYPVKNSYTKPKDFIVTLLINKSNPKLDTISFTHSMKGWELYSYPKENQWNYSILQGTNRAKTFDEVITNKIRVLGKDSLKMLLNKFPAQEELFWIGKRLGDDWETLSLPDNNTINEITTFCSQKQLRLSIIH